MDLSLLGGLFEEPIGVVCYGCGGVLDDLEHSQRMVSPLVPCCILFETLYFLVELLFGRV